MNAALMLVLATTVLRVLLCLRQLRHWSRAGAAAVVMGRLRSSLRLMLLQGLAAGTALALWQTAGTWWWALACAAMAMSYGPSAVEAWRRRRRRGGRAELDPDSLGMRLCGSLGRWGHPQVRLLVERCAPNSPQLNARAELSGAAGSIVLLDTLAQSLAPPEVEAVMAHELGHLACAHLQRRNGLLVAVWLAALGLGTALVWSDSARPAGWATLGAVLLVVPSLRFLLQPLVMHCLRRWELEADAFAASLVMPAELARTLVRLLELNGAAPPSDRWFALFHDSHPLLHLRLERLRSM